MAYDPTDDPFAPKTVWDHAYRQQQKQMEQIPAPIRPPTPPPKTIGSARVIDGTLKLMFTDGTRIDIPMAVVSEIVAVVLAGRLAMGLSEAEPTP